VSKEEEEKYKLMEYNKQRQHKFLPANGFSSSSKFWTSADLQSVDIWHYYQAKATTVYY
jgi:hypothetical protein